MRSHERLEDELREALRREEAPAGFAERVLANARVAAVRDAWWRKWISTGNVRALRYATAVVLLIAAVGGTVEYRRYEEEQRQGELAKQQLMLALRIAGRKLQYAQAKVNRAGAEQSIPTVKQEEERQ